jgi:hypothetical protein
VIQLLRRASSAECPQDILKRLGSSLSVALLLLLLRLGGRGLLLRILLVGVSILRVGLRLRGRWYGSRCLHLLLLRLLLLRLLSAHGLDKLEPRLPRCIVGRLVLLLGWLSGHLKLWGVSRLRCVRCRRYGRRRRWCGSVRDCWL